MTHGAPDNYQIQQKATTYRLDDMAEAAVRLGMIPSIDRLGEVIAYEDFSDGWGRSRRGGSGVSYSVNITSESFFTGGFSAKLIAGTTTAGSAWVQLPVPYLYLSKFGLEYRFNPTTHIDYILGKFYIYTGEAVYWAEVKIDDTNEKMLIYLGNDVYQEIESSFKLAHAGGVFSAIKLVIDAVNKKYVRIRSHGESYNISSYDIPSGVSTASPKITTEFRIYSDGAINGSGYLDSIIITQNEP